jgi:Na+/H+-dicarboxylate symporter
MCRTSVNLLGNCVATAVVARWEGVKLSKDADGELALATDAA